MADPQTLNETLQSQIGEQDGAREKLLRLCRQNKLAVVSAVVILLILLMAVFAPLIAPYGEAEQDALNRLQPPSAEHWFGTDELGRDVFSRVLYGSRLSLAIGILPSIVSLAIGIVAGLLAGYFGGWLDYIIMRIADVMLSIPSLLLAMVVMYTLGSSTVNLFVALSMVGWASVARVVRSQTLSIKVCCTGPGCRWPSASCPASSRWPSASWPGCWPGISAAGWTMSSCASRM